MSERTQTVQSNRPTLTPVQSGILQRKCACGNHTVAGGECDACRQKREGTLQRAAANHSPTNAVPPIVHEVLRSPGQPLDASTRAFMEPRFGQDFSQVRVHTDARAAESAHAVNALAYTVGNNVVFADGQFSPQSQEGKRLIAHELTHTIQQGHQSHSRSAVPPSVVALETSTEREAEKIAFQVINQLPVTTATSLHSLAIQRATNQGRCSNANIANCTDEDLLTAICIGEAGNIKDTDGKKGVMNVAMNRVAAGGFGGSISAVATAPRQFDGLRNGINQLNNAAFASCRVLAQEVMASPQNDPTWGAVFFNQSCAKSCDEYCTVYLGDGKSAAHYFARRATAKEKKSCKGMNRHCCRTPKQKVYIMPEIEIVGKKGEVENNVQDNEGLE